MELKVEKLSMPGFPVAPFSGSALRAIASCVTAVGCGALIVVLLYLIKSALGINLMPGPSPLHLWLYPLLGRG
jgi:hypothetical protein